MTYIHRNWKMLFDLYLCQRNTITESCVDKYIRNWPPFTTKLFQLFTSCLKAYGNIIQGTKLHITSKIITSSMTCFNRYNILANINFQEYEISFPFVLNIDGFKHVISKV